MRDTRQEIIHFWFEETAPQQWFQNNPALDEAIKDRFGTTLEMADDGLCNTWSVDVDGCLALVLLLDQFPRHVYRGTPQSLATDEKALLVAKQALHKGFDQVLDPVKRGFLYIPFQHSENLNDQKRSVELYGAMKDDNPTGFMYAERHYTPIEKFNRFPHRNEVLGRESTAEEIEFLKTNAGFL